MTKNEFLDFYKKFTVVDKFLVVFFVLGLIVFSVSLFRGIVVGGQVEVEYVKGSSIVSGDKLIIDVSGGVIRPGVYEMPSNSRIKDALIVAEGLSVEADRDYVQKNINLAEKLIDGQKIYIPTKSNTPPSVGYTEPNFVTKKMNINLATEKELDTLKGIGAVRAVEIINNRPYKSVEELVSKGVVTKGILDKIREDIVAY